MSAAIGPGDWVECIDAHTVALGAAPWGVKEGCLYLVDRCCADPDVGELLWISGIPPSSRGGYCAWRFRPVYRPKASLIESLKAPLRTPLRAKKAREESNA